MVEAERGQELSVVAAKLRGQLEAVQVIAPAYDCVECSDTGYVTSRKARIDGKQVMQPAQVASPCACRVEAAAIRRMERAGVPLRYAGATIENFRTEGLEPSVMKGLAAVKMAAREAPLGSGGRGLLLCGTCGTGKTHLSVGLLRKSMTLFGVSGRFWNVGELLSEIRFTFGRPDAADMERSMRRQLESVDVLVLDDLGAERSTDWASDQVVPIINDRYDAGRVTHITTNYPNLGAGEGSGRGETLGDRIGARMFSRVQEMCLAVEMKGQDFRRRKVWAG